MTNKEKSKLVSKASKLIEDSLSVLDQVEDNMTANDKRITKLYYQILSNKDHLDAISENFKHLN